MLMMRIQITEGVLKVFMLVVSGVDDGVDVGVHIGVKWWCL